MHVTRLTKLCSDDDGITAPSACIDEDEDATFDAETHHNFCIKTFNYFEADFELWVECQAADRSAVNLTLGRMFKFTAISCCNHTLQHEFNLTKESMPTLVSMI